MTNNRIFKSIYNEACRELLQDFINTSSSTTVWVPSLTVKVNTTGSSHVKKTVKSLVNNK